MADLSDWLNDLDVSPAALVVGVLIVAAIVITLAIEGLPSGRAAIPSAVAVFVLAMVVLDLRRRD